MSGNDLSNDRSQPHETLIGAGNVATLKPGLDLQGVDGVIHPTGVGQMPVPIVAAAVNNAVAGLTGARLRESPMTRERVKKALG